MRADHPARDHKLSTARGRKEAWRLTQLIPEELIPDLQIEKQKELDKSKCLCETLNLVGEDTCMQLVSQGVCGSHSVGTYTWHPTDVVNACYI